MKHIVRGNNVLKHVYYLKGAAMLQNKTMANVLHSLKRLNAVEIKVDTTAVILQGEQSHRPRASSSSVKVGSIDEGKSFDAADLNSLSGVHERVPSDYQESPSASSSKGPPTPFLKRFISEGSGRHLLGQSVQNLVNEAKDTAKKAFKRKSKHSSFGVGDSDVQANLAIAAGEEGGESSGRGSVVKMKEVRAQLVIVSARAPHPPTRLHQMLAQPSSTLTQTHLVFHPNKAKVELLRVARQRGMDAWQKKLRGNHHEIIDRRVRSHQEVVHEMARTINFTTLVLRAVEAKEGGGGGGGGGSTLELEAVGPSRVVEVPDDDNTLLFSTRPKAIRPIGFHNDIHAANNFITFAATYIELLPPSEAGEMARVHGGQRIWRVLLHYYPHDRSARVVDPKWEDDKYSSPRFANSKLPARFKNARASLRKTWGGEVAGDFESSDFE